MAMDANFGLEWNRGMRKSAIKKEVDMQRKKKMFSAIEIILVVFMLGSLLLSFLKSRCEEKE